MADVLTAGVTNDIYLTGYRVRRTKAAITDATMTATVYDMAGNAVSGASALSLTYDATNSEYYVAVPKSAGLVAGSEYIIEVVASNYDDIFRLTAPCVSPGGRR